MANTPVNPVVPGLYQLLDSLEREDEQSLKECECTSQRRNLLDRYAVPYNPIVVTGKPGFNLLNYEQNNNFNTFIQLLIDGSKQWLVEVPYTLPLEKRLSIPKWVTTQFFSFLNELTQNPDLLQRLRNGTPAQRQQLLAQYLKDNAYGEREAIEQLLANPKNDTPFADTVNKISTTFQNHFRFCC